MKIVKSTPKLKGNCAEMKKCRVFRDLYVEILQVMNQISKNYSGANKLKKSADKFQVDFLLINECQRIIKGYES